MARRAVLACLIFSGAAWAPRAAAQDSAVAEVLFDQGRVLMQQGKYAEACPKFGESQRIAPSVGALLNLAECFVKLGKTASAWATFKEAGGAAQAAGQIERLQLARERTKELEARLSKLVIGVSPATDLPGLVLERDGVQLARTAWGAAIPADPGSHEVIASAPGRKTWRAVVMIAAEPRLTTVTVPPLEIEATTSPIVPAERGETPSRAEPVGWPAQRTTALVVAGVGVASIGVGAFFGLRALSAKSDATAHCPTVASCDAEGYSRGQDAHAAATTSTVLFLVGGAALALGGVLWLSVPKVAGGANVALRLRPGALEGAW